MERLNLDNLLRRLMDLSHEIARGSYRQAEALFALTRNGEHQMKNVGQPVRVYQVLLDP